MPENPKAREITFVFGKTGFGKSNYLKGYLSTLPRVFILDPMYEYPGVEFEDLSDMMDYVEGRETFCVKSCNPLDLEVMSEIVASMPNVAFLVDEAQRCLPMSRESLPFAFSSLILQGRHFSQSVIIAAQRPSIVHITARSQWTRIVSFHLTEAIDVGWLEGTTGYRLTSDHDIRKLPVGDYLEFSGGLMERKRAPLYVPKKQKGGNDSGKLDHLFSGFKSLTA